VLRYLVDRHVVRPGYPDDFDAVVDRLGDVDASAFFSGCGDRVSRFVQGFYKRFVDLVSRRYAG
jgi:hypothetical protein